MKHEWKMSASCIGAFKACPMKFRLAYVEGLRLAEDTESQRIGTNWHKLLEIASMNPGDTCLCLPGEPEADPDCPICKGTGMVPADDMPLDRAVRWLNYCYSTVPPNKDATEWAVERAILAYSLAGYLWLYTNDQIETVAREIKFDLPLRNPKTGRALPNVRRVGKIDRIILHEGRLMVNEYKSTGKPVNSGSALWERLNLDTQISHYICAAQELSLLGELSVTCDAVPSLIAETLYDVWHKPGIRPKMLTQAESKEFVKTEIYYKQKFETEERETAQLDQASNTVDTAAHQQLFVDGVEAEVSPGKKEGTFTVRETPEMFGARLLADIQKRPEFYFARRPIARTADQVLRHHWQTYYIYQTARQMERNGYWWDDPTQCDATFRCQYAPICWHGMEVFDGKTIPPGFRRIFDIEAPVVEEE